MISSTPDAAYEMCTEYCPPCDRPFKYRQLEISIESTTKQEITRLNNNNNNTNININTTSSTKPKVNNKEGKKKKGKKNLQALESRYTSTDNYGYATPNYDEFDEDYDDSEDEDDNHNRIYSGETDLLSVTRTPFFQNDVN